MPRPTGGTNNRGTFALLLAAVLLPSLIFVALQFAFGYRAERRADEASTMARADLIMAAVDGDLQRTRASVLVLASASSIRQRDWRRAYGLARKISALNPDWLGVRLADVRRGLQLFDTREPYAAPSAVSIDPDLASNLGARSILFGNIDRQDAGCPCLRVEAPLRDKDGLHLLLTVFLDPKAVQGELMRRAPADGTSAIVDGRGNFIARTRDFARRLGTPATPYVLGAVKRGKAGLYAGVTYEGLPDYTAMAPSSLSGWSTHVGVPQAELDSPRWWSRVASLIAFLISLSLAIGLGWLLLRLINAQRAADARVHHAQRLEAVGKMTGGIAHDFNNMLSIVIGSLDLAKRRRAQGRDDIDHFLDNALDGANRASDLTKRLLAFSRRQELTPVGTDLNRLLEAMRELLVQTLTAAVHLRIDLEQVIWPVLVDRGQLENAIVNLGANARDAMPCGGELVIATANVVLDPSHAKALGLPAGDYVLISVTDNGQGMSPETIHRAFEPFFTTKEVGRGTGLGLSQIYGFLAQSGGRARLRSDLGAGTTVELYLPRYHGGATKLADASDQRETVPTGSAREIILVVDDELGVRRTTVEALRELGYSVRHAAEAKEALDILAVQPEIALLVTDIVLPGMSGRDLAKAARGLHPDLKFLFVTGYEREERDEPLVECNLLRKPFTVEAIAREVRERLDAPVQAEPSTTAVREGLVPNHKTGPRIGV